MKYGTGIFYNFQMSMHNMGRIRNSKCPSRINYSGLTTKLVVTDDASPGQCGDPQLILIC